MKIIENANDGWQLNIYIYFPLFGYFQFSFVSFSFILLCAFTFCIRFLLNILLFRFNLFQFYFYLCNFFPVCALIKMFACLKRLHFHISALFPHMVLVNNRVNYPFKSMRCSETMSIVKNKNKYINK